VANIHEYSGSYCRTGSGSDNCILCRNDQTGGKGGKYTAALCNAEKQGNVAGVPVNAGNFRSILYIDFAVGTKEHQRPLQAAVINRIDGDIGIDSIGGSEQCGGKFPAEVVRKQKKSGGNMELCGDAAGNDSWICGIQIYEQFVGSSGVVCADSDPRRIFPDIQSDGKGIEPAGADRLGSGCAEFLVLCIHSSVPEYKRKDITELCGHRGTELSSGSVLRSIYLLNDNELMRTDHSVLL